MSCLQLMSSSAECDKIALYSPNCTCIMISYSSNQSSRLWIVFPPIHKKCRHFLWIGGSITVNLFCNGVHLDPMKQSVEVFSSIMKC